MGRFQIALFTLVLSVATFGLFSSSVRADSLADVIALVYKNHPEIPTEALQEAFAFYQDHSSQVTNKNYVTVIDFGLPSTANRMYVIDMNSGDVSAYLVAHGMNTGELYAQYFSNVENSLMSSLGMYLTGDPYVGNDGISMRLLGQDDTNSNAFTRDIVVHGAAYVSQSFIAQVGRLGRSEGCPAVELQYAAQIINELESGSVYLIYKK